jgi:hypothetical protein
MSRKFRLSLHSRTLHSRAPESQGAIRCFSCPCGCVCLRWRRALLLHLDRTELSCAMDCLKNVLERPSCSFCLGDASFCASLAGDGYYYLLCKDSVVLRLSESEARGLHAELAAASEMLDQKPRPATTIM